MRYVMKQKLFSWGDDFTIKDVAGTERFSWTARHSVWETKLSFRNMNGQELAFIRQKLLAWGPTYEIYRNGELSRRGQEAAFHVSSTADSPSTCPAPNDLEAQRQLHGPRIHILERIGRCCHSLQAVVTWTDTYGVDIANGEDDVLILASTVVNRHVCHGDRQKALSRALTTHPRSAEYVRAQKSKLLSIQLKNCVGFCPGRFV